MGLAEILKNVKGPEKKVRAKNRKSVRKFGSKVKKFFNRPGQYVVGVGQTKCLTCNWEAFGHRLGCGQCSLEVMNIEHGASISTESINTARNKRAVPLMGKTQFISYKEILRRLKEGDRFFDISSKKELTVQDFENAN